MKLVERYIGKTVLASIALSTLMMAGLQLFILFVHELDDIGRGDYGLMQVCQFVLLQMLYQIYLFFPMCCVLGCMAGLGMLAKHSELVVMRAAGMSIAQVTWAVTKAALVVIVVATLIGEIWLPKWIHFADDQKLQAKSGGQTVRTAAGFWTRYKNDFINIALVQGQRTLLNVEQFHFDDTHYLRIARKIDKINYEQHAWHAYGITETHFLNKKTKVKHLDSMLWDIALKPEVLSVNNKPDEMSLPALRRYLRAQKMNHQTAYRYQLAYLQRLMQPLTTIIMMLLAIPVIFGPLRSSSMGSKLLVGVTLGFSYNIINRFLGPLTYILQWPVQLIAFGPTCIFILLGLYLMHRAK